MPPLARKAKPGPPEVSTTEDGKITVTDSTTRTTSTYPDYTEQWLEFLRRNGGASALRDSWAFMREAESILNRSPMITVVEGWVKLDDSPSAYYVRVSRKPRARRGASEYVIVGVVRLDKIDVP